MAKDSFKFTEKLKKAVLEGDEKAVRRLIKGGVNVNYTYWGGGSLLHEAIITGNLDIVRILLEAGISPDCTLETGDTALHLSSSRGKKDIVSLLLQFKANINAKNKDYKTPLHFALWKARVEVAHILITQGADVNSSDVDEWTPLFWAVKHPSLLSVAELLINKGASVNHKTSKDMTPLHKSLAEGNVSAARLLVQHGSEFYHSNTANSVMTAMLKRQDLPFVHSFNGNLRRLELEINRNPDWYLSLLFGPGQVTRRPSSVSLEDPEARRDPNRRIKLLMPGSLAHNCRKAIRLQLSAVHKGKYIVSRVHDLPIPELLKRYILYR